MTTDATPAAAVRFVFLLWIGFNLLVSALVVLIPLRMTDLGFGVDSIAIVVGAAGIGGVISAEPIGRLAGRFGAVRMYRYGLVALAGFFITLGTLDNLVVLVLVQGAIGVCVASVRIGSQMVVRNRIADARRGRVHATQGAISRGANFVAPVLAGFAWERLRPEWSFAVPVLAAMALLMAAGTLAVRPTPQTRAGRTATPLSTILRYTGGLILFNASRSGRMLLLPLLGLGLGLSPARIGLLVGLTSATDVLVSPISGVLMDSRGRLFTIVPAFTLMSLGFIILASASGGWMLIIAAAVLGLGNGFSSGLFLTLGTDLAPQGGEGPFLGRFGAFTDIGRLIGPFMVGTLGATLGLGAAALALAVVTLIGLAVIVIFVGETRPTAVAA